MALAQKIMDRLLELSTALHSCDPDQQRASLMGSAGLGIGIGPGGEWLFTVCELDLVIFAWFFVVLYAIYPVSPI